VTLLSSLPVSSRVYSPVTALPVREPLVSDSVVVAVVWSVSDRL
jgi:hypothetical protein